MKKHKKRRIVMLGAAGCGKGCHEEVLNRAFGTKVITTSQELNGGTASGALCHDRDVCAAVAAAFIRENFFRSDFGHSIAVDGIPRTVKQAEWLTQLFVAHEIMDAETAFVFMNISTPEAIMRMKMRYHQHLVEYHDPKHPRTELRREEYGSKEEVYQRFWSRAAAWIKERSKIKEVIASATRGTGAHLLDVCASGGFEEVSGLLVSSLGWDTSVSELVAAQVARTHVVAPKKEQWDSIPPVLHEKNPQIMPSWPQPHQRLPAMA